MGLKVQLSEASAVADVGELTAPAGKETAGDGAVDGEGLLEDVGVLGDKGSSGGTWEPLPSSSLAPDACQVGSKADVDLADGMQAPGAQAEATQPRSGKGPRVQADVFALAKRE